MGRDHIGLSLPVCGTACPMSPEQRQASGSSKFRSAHGYTQDVTALCVAVEKLRFVSCVVLTLYLMLCFLCYAFLSVYDMLIFCLIVLHVFFQ